MLNNEIGWENSVLENFSKQRKKIKRMRMKSIKKKKITDSGIKKMQL
jgi:hypothetical protein